MTAKKIENSVRRGVNAGANERVDQSVIKPRMISIGRGLVTILPRNLFVLRDLRGATPGGSAAGNSRAGADQLQ